jgi:anti-anti-sigma factor
MLDISTDTAALPGCLLIRVVGEASLREVDGLQLQLRRIGSAHPQRVIIDLAHVTFMASLAMGTLVEFTSGIKVRKGRVAVAGASGMLLDAIRRARLDTLFVMADTVESAASTLREIVPEVPAAASPSSP